MLKRKGIDFSLMEKYPNKYNLTIKSIKKLVIKDWDNLKKETWFNDAMKKTGNWWCHLEGCNKDGERYSSEDEFWIGFNEDDNRIDCNFSCYDGMCKYEFDQFYNLDEIENKFDMQVQINAIRWINKLIDEEILEQST